MQSSYSLYRCAVLATSSSSLAQVVGRDSLVQILPLGVCIDGRSVADDIEIDNAQYCRWRAQHPDQSAATEPPPADDLRNVFQHLINQGYHEAIVVTLSSQLSETAAAVRALAADFAPHLVIHVVDSGSCCMPEGFFALEALRLLKEGRDTQQVLAYLAQLKPRSHIVFGLLSLKPLPFDCALAKMGARVSDWLGLRTVLYFGDGRLQHIDSAASDEHMFDDIIHETQQLMAGKESERFVLAGLYSGDYDVYHRFAERFRQQTGRRLGEGLPVSAAVAVHVGIGAVGVGLVEKPLP